MNKIVLIKNWDKYNPRKDIKHPRWFAMEHMFFYDSKFYDFTPEELVCWFFLLCEASKNTPRGEYRVQLNHFTVCSRLNSGVLHRAISKLVRNQVIELRSVRGRYVHVHDPYATQQNNTGQDMTEQDRTQTTFPQNKNSTASHFFHAALSDDFTQSLLEKVNEEIQTSWVSLYEDTEWIKQEIKKAKLWCQSNPKRAPKQNYAKFLTAWLARGWEKYRKTLPSHPISRGIADILGDEVK